MDKRRETPARVKRMKWKRRADANGSAERDLTKPRRAGTSNHKGSANEFMVEL
jgi:hypothetical protein